MSRHPRCGSYRPGHRQHWIQGKKSLEPDQPVITMYIVAVHDDGRVDLEGDDENLTLWHHDTDRLRWALRFGGRAEWKPKFHVLYVVSVGSFNMARLDQVQPCATPTRQRPTETTEQYLERAARENHGFTISQRWLAGGRPAGTDGEATGGADHDG